MNIEKCRLDTYDTWPPLAPLTPHTLAKSGFFYTLTDYATQCFSCGLVISDWHLGANVSAIHAAQSSQCQFLRNPIISGNVPDDDTTTAATMDHHNHRDNNYFHVEAHRMTTYTNWPVTEIVSPERLARAGFYATGRFDFVKCAFCEGIVGAWEWGDCPDREHKRHFPQCPFVVTVIEPRIETIATTGQTSSADYPCLNSNLSLVMQGNLDELGVRQHKGPRRPKYTTVGSRLETFVAWPEHLVQTPDVLSQAGFFYEGAGDHVRCFHCDGGLKHWDPHDDPWTEHARWFPQCAFVQLIKGQEFVTACMPDLDSKTNMEISQKRCTPASSKPPCNLSSISDRDVEQHMTSAAALAALNIGLHVGRVKQAIREKLAQTGVGFSSSDALIEATLNMQRDEDEHMGETSSNNASVLSSGRENSNSSSSRQYSPAEEISENLIEHMLNEALDNDNTLRDVATASVALPESVVDKPTTSTEVVIPPADKIEKLSLVEENRVLKEARLCKICMDSEVGIVFLPCGHLATCVNCAPNLQDCPVCRSSIRATVRTFLS